MILFERNDSNHIITKTDIHFDCYSGKSLIGYFEVYYDFGYLNDKGEKKRKEIYIEVLKKHQHKGYAKQIYESFIKKHRQLGFKDSVFYAYVLNKNVASLTLHKSLKFKIFKQYKVQTIFEVK